MKKNTQVKVRYESTQALYASQFVLNVSDDEVIVNFASSLLPDASSGDSHLPVHTRIALSRNGAQKLAQLLLQATSGQPTEGEAASATAKIPSIN